MKNGPFFFLEKNGMLYEVNNSRPYFGENGMKTLLQK